jgi:hypothetical protein
MHPRTQEVLAYLDDQRAALKTALDDMPPSLRSERPAADRWSAAEVLEHLVLVEARIGTLLEGHLAKARKAGLEAERETTPILPTFDAAAMLDRTRTFTASTASMPQGAMDASAAWAALQTKREEVKALILSADGLALGDIQIPNSRFGTLNFYQWVLFLGAHEGRHAAQIEEVMAKLTMD